MGFHFFFEYESLFLFLCMSSNFGLYSGQCELHIVEILNSVLFLCRKLVFVSKQLTWFTSNSNNLFPSVEITVQLFFLNSTPWNLSACGFQRSVGYEQSLYTKFVILSFLVFPQPPCFPAALVVLRYLLCFFEAMIRPWVFYQISAALYGLRWGLHSHL